MRRMVSKNNSDIRYRPGVKYDLLDYLDYSYEGLVIIKLL